MLHALIAIKKYSLIATFLKAKYLWACESLVTNEERSGTFQANSHKMCCVWKALTTVIWYWWSWFVYPSIHCNNSTNVSMFSFLHISVFIILQQLLHNANFFAGQKCFQWLSFWHACVCTRHMFRHKFCFWETVVCEIAKWCNIFIFLLPV